MSQINYVWDVESDSVLMHDEPAGSTVFTSEPGLAGAPISQRHDATTETFHFDGSGSTRELTVSSGAVTDAYTYTAWGASTASVGSSENSVRFKGMMAALYDGEVGRYSIGSRQYEPVIARWQSVDVPNSSSTEKLTDYLFESNNPERTARFRPPGVADPTGSFAAALGFNVEIPPSGRFSQRPSGIDQRDWQIDWEKILRDRGMTIGNISFDSGGLGDAQEFNSVLGTVIPRCGTRCGSGTFTARNRLTFSGVSRNPVCRIFDIFVRKTVRDVNDAFKSLEV